MKSFRSKSIIFVTALVAWAALTGAAGVTYVVGSSRCRECHEAAHDAWRNSAHAKSSSQLSEKEKKDVRCQKCHTTGEGKYLEIGCEACHGGGRYYSFPYVMRDRELSRLVGLEDPTEKTCLRCHTQDSSMIRPFDLARAMDSIKHWKDKTERKPDDASAR